MVDCMFIVQKCNGEYLSLAFMPNRYPCSDGQGLRIIKGRLYWTNQSFLERAYKYQQLTRDSIII